MLLPTAKAQTKYYQAVYFNSKAQNCDWSGWVDSGVAITINYLRRCIEIHSNTPQVINYAALTESKKSNYTLYTANALDSNQKLIQVTFQVFNNKVFYLTIKYSDGMYSYNLVELDPD